MELYETEYNEDDFKKTIKNHTYHHHQVVPDQETNMNMVKDIEFIPPDEESMVVERSIGLSFDSFFSSQEEDSEESTYISLDDDESARTRKRRSNEETVSKRNDIDKRMRTLQNLLPNSHKDDNESLLDETINYMTTLQHQVQIMTMSNGFVIPSMILAPLVPHYTQMGLATGIQMGVPQFLSHPGLVPIQNSTLFTSMEHNCSPRSVPRSCVATYPNQVPTQVMQQPTQPIKKR